jgi:predicted ferric reductase
MPEYVNPGIEKGQELNAEASSTFDEGTEARETADRYVRQTVLLATVLFLVAVAQRFKYRAVRLTAGAIAAVILIVAVSGIVTLPRI